MCGITGYKNFSNKSDLSKSLENATESLKLRGPNTQGTYLDRDVGLGHTRLSIIDTSAKANQPMIDYSGRYVLSFNGEIYNYKELAENLEVDFVSTSDTEVLLYLLIQEGVECLPKLNGFFSFAFYDLQDQSLLIARDRMGIKPLHYYQGEDFFVFGSEMKALLNYPIPREVDLVSLHSYLQFTYLPHELSMIKGVKKLLPGHYIRLAGKQTNIERYWSMEEPSPFIGTYEEAKQCIVQSLETSVEKRMVADVPLGAFLSGGTDSSAVVSMASKFNPSLNTFSIGYEDHPFFDETDYAELVAKKFNTNHTTFSLSNDDLLNSIDEIIHYIDEPFADSSAIPTYILSQKVSKNMRVALSGDGADELFGGYYKHLAFQKSNQKNTINSLIRALHPLLNTLPQSRSSKLGNTARRLSKYGDLLHKSRNDRYWHLAAFNHQAKDLLLNFSGRDFQSTHPDFHLQSEAGLNDFLDIDIQIVLPGDMLTKVDLMSMANSLEVRVPFLDPHMVELARALPAEFKVNKNKRKMVLQDAFEHILPKELHHRSKKGFEVPMLNWMKNELATELDTHVFNTDFLREQKIFNPPKVMHLRKKLHARNTEDVHSTIWSLYVFQRWYQRYIGITL